MKLISTEDAAKALGVSDRRVRQLIDEGKLPAQTIGGTYVINEADLDAVKVYGKAGRPPKPASTEKRARGQKRVSNGASRGRKRGQK